MNRELFRTLEPGRALLGALMLGVGILHFTHAPLFEAIVPDYLPARLFLVYASGVCELALGVLLWFRRSQELAAWGLIALYVAVFPANVHMALHPDLPLPGIADADRPGATALWLRLPLQLALLYWAYRYTRRRGGEERYGAMPSALASPRT
jgi:uncharacterized membrane protein